MKHATFGALSKGNSRPIGGLCIPEVLRAGTDHNQVQILLFSVAVIQGQGQSRREIRSIK